MWMMPGAKPKVGLDAVGLSNIGEVYWTPTTAKLYEEIVRNKEGFIVHLGPVVVYTDPYTGRSPDDKFVVREPSSEANVWWGDVNRPFDVAKFDLLFHRIQAYLQSKKVYVQDCIAGADPQYNLPLRIVTEYAWHSLFARNLFRQIDEPKELAKHEPEFTVIDVPGFRADPDIDGTSSEAFIVLNFARKLALIGGTRYGGEIKKSIFTVMNYILPLRNVMSMHCGANSGHRDGVALFFGLSGTGKTTLSADPNRNLIGDDEHGWSDSGIFNFEGGCYAKVIRLKAESEPEIYETTRRFGTVLENVLIDEASRRLDLDDDSMTENTRAAYPLTHISNIVPSGTGGHPENLILLTCDAFGVMPPVARLTPDQAVYHFLSGYTAKVAGTEKGMDSSPKATFSTCFGAPFMALRPTVYSSMLRDKVDRHKVKCWLVNTGWSGGPFGTGARIKIEYSRAMVNAIVSGELNGVEFQKDRIFGLNIPVSCPGVPSEVLQPSNTWRDMGAYETKARELVGLFKKNFGKFKDDVSEDVRKAGPT
jgi:phosphoenolpyruvate carboxykinase (ATP)